MVPTENMVDTNEQPMVAARATALKSGAASGVTSSGLGIARNAILALNMGQWSVMGMSRVSLTPTPL